MRRLIKHLKNPCGISALGTLVALLYANGQTTDASKAIPAPACLLPRYGLFLLLTLALPQGIKSLNDKAPARVPLPRVGTLRRGVLNSCPSLLRIHQGPETAWPRARSLLLLSHSVTFRCFGHEPFVVTCQARSRALTPPLPAPKLES